MFTPNAPGIMGKILTVAGSSLMGLFEPITTFMTLVIEMLLDMRLH